MDTKTLLAEAKARFNHNAAKAYLKEKYRGKLIIADQGGLWNSDIQTINFLTTQITESVVLVDTYDNPVEVNRIELLTKLLSTYTAVMKEWHSEWVELEKKR